MHELSIAESLLDQVREAARTAAMAQVLSVTIRVGELSGLLKEPLQTGWEVVTTGTELAQAALRIEWVPVTAHCQRCQRVVTIKKCWQMVCPDCQQFCPEAITGRELELFQLEGV